MKRPSFQFYPGDWQANSNLRRCTHAEKGAWIDVMCLMHDQNEYGVLRWSLKEISQATGAALPLLKGLVSKFVMKGSDSQPCEAFVYTPRSGRKEGEPVVLVPSQPGPIWYSARMVRDEYVRTIRGESTRFGAGDGETPKQAPKTAPKASPKPPFGDGPSSSSSSSYSGTNVPDAKDRVWTLGPALLGEKSRSLIGKLVAQYGEDVLAEALSAAAAEQPGDPKAWLVRACEAQAKRKTDAAKLGGHPELLADPKPRWALDAGFASRFEANNDGCFEHNAALFRDGKKVAA